jgi:hypothetical protein
MKLNHIWPHQKCNPYYFTNLQKIYCGEFKRKHDQKISVPSESRSSSCHRMILLLEKPLGDRDHEVLGMGSFGEYAQSTIWELSRPTTSYKG